MVLPYGNERLIEILLNIARFGSGAIAREVIELMGGGIQEASELEGSGIRIVERDEVDLRADDPCNEYAAIARARLNPKVGRRNEAAVNAILDRFAPLRFAGLAALHNVADREDAESEMMLQTLKAIDGFDIARCGHMRRLFRWMTRVRTWGRP